LKRTVGQSPPTTIYKRERSNKLTKFNRGREHLYTRGGEGSPQKIEKGIKRRKLESLKTN
jgi:hypothetical protein